MKNLCDLNAISKNLKRTYIIKFQKFLGTFVIIKKFGSKYE